MLAHDIPLRFVKVLNIICITIPFACCWYGYYSKQMKDSFYNKGNLLMIDLFSKFLFYHNLRFFFTNRNVFDFLDQLCKTGFFFFCKILLANTGCI